MCVCCAWFSWRESNFLFFRGVQLDWRNFVFFFPIFALVYVSFGATGLRGVNQIVSFVVSSWTSAIRFVFF